MNQLQGTIKEIKNAQGITQIFVDVQGSTMSSLLLDGDATYQKEECVKLLFKETEVMIATPNSKVSARNSFVSQITSIEVGEILAQVDFDFEGKKIVSIITKGSLDALGCRVGDCFMWFIKSNEISIQSQRAKEYAKVEEYE